MKAFNRLSNLECSFVSLVNRAAVRDPSDSEQPMRFLLTKSEVPVIDLDKSASTNPSKKWKSRGKNRKPKKGPRSFAGKPITEQRLQDMHDRATTGRKNKRERDEMSKHARATIKKLDAGEPLTAGEISQALADATCAAAAEIRKSDPTISELDAHRQALRQGGDVSRLQDAYLETVNPTAAEIMKADRAGRAEAAAAGVLPAAPRVSGSVAAAEQLRKAAAEGKLPGESDYEAAVREIRSNPGRYTEVA